MTWSWMNPFQMYHLLVSVRIYFSPELHQFTADHTPNLNRLNVSSGTVNKGSPIGAPAHSSECTLHRPVGLRCSSLQRIWMSTYRAASTLCQCTHVNSPLIPLRSRIFRTVFSAAHPVLSLPYFPPQDGIKSLNFHWTKSIQLNTPRNWKHVEGLLQPAYSFY